MALTPAEKQKAYRERMRSVERFQEMMDLGLSRQPCPEDANDVEQHAWAQGVWQAQSAEQETERQKRRRDNKLPNDSKDRIARAKRYEDWLAT